MNEIMQTIPAVETDQTANTSTFTNDLFGEVRVLVEDDNTVLFCATDVAKALGYRNPPKTVNDHCRYITKRYIPHPQADDKRIELLFIPESDVYRLVFGSKKPEAEKFTDWITREVIPNVLRQG
jgi:anti-repressor protein